MPGDIKVQLGFRESRWLHPTLKVLGAGAVVARKLKSPVLGRAIVAGAEAAIRHGVHVDLDGRRVPVDYATAAEAAAEKAEPPRAGSGLICGGGPKAGS